MLSAAPVRADNRFIVRYTLGSSALSQLCLLQTCTVVGAIDGTLNQVFLLPAPSLIHPTTLRTLLRNTPGIVNAELDQVINLVGGLNAVTPPPTALTASTAVNYFGTTVWNGYANQPASGIVHVQDAQNTFHVSGKGIVADIDTGVDPNHPALKSVLLAGYDFTRNQPGGSEMTDFTGTAPTPCPSCQPAKVNQSTAAVLDQSTAAVLDGNSQYAAFGHGTMVIGVIHRAAPPGEAIVRTYTLSRCSAGWGTSFSAPFVSGGAALLRARRTDINQSLASAAIAHAQFVGADMGNGRLDLLMALAALPVGSR